MSEDFSFNRDQKKEEERKITPDFFGPLGKGMLAKEKIETLGNSSGLTPLGFGVEIRKNNIDQENNEMLANSPGLKTLHPFDQIYSIKKKSVSLIQDLSDNEDLKSLKNSSGLTPLNYDTEPPMYAIKGRYSPLRTQSLSLMNISNKGE